MDLASLEVASDAARLDVDDPARAQLDRVGRRLRRGDRLVQADRRPHQPGELGMGQDLLLGQRLLDEKQLERIERRKVLRIGKRVGGVRVDLQRHVAEAFAHSAHRLDVPPGLDLQLDPPVSLLQVRADGLQQLRDRAVDTDRHAAIDGLARGAEELSERFAAPAQLRVEHRHLERALGHVVAVNRAEDPRHVGGREVAIEQPGYQRADQHRLGAFDVLGGVGRLLARHALAPSLMPVGERMEQQDVALHLNPEGSLEWRDERQLDPPQLDGVEPHALRLSSRLTSPSLRVRSAAAAFSSSWRTLDAPGIATTLGLRTSQASATCAAVTPRSAAMSRKASMSGARLARPSEVKSPRKRRKLAGGADWYFPDRRPCPSGLYAMTIRPAF